VTASAFCALRTVVRTVAPNALASWIAVVPMPLAPPWISTDSPALSWPRSNRLCQTGEVVLRQRRGVQHVEALGQRQALRRGHRAVFGVGAARRQRAHRIADLPSGDAVAQRRDRAGGLEARQVRGAGGGG
jgi:hypothetical protein